jgi:hypothetical protein
MSVLIHCPLETGLLILADKREHHKQSGTYNDDVQKIMQFDRFWAFVALGDAAHGGPPEHRAAPGFLFGTIPVASFSVHDALHQFVTANPPPKLSYTGEPLLTPQIKNHGASRQVDTDWPAEFPLQVRLAQRILYAFKDMGLGRKRLEEIWSSPSNFCYRVTAAFRTDFEERARAYLRNTSDRQSTYMTRVCGHVESEYERFLTQFPEVRSALINDPLVGRDVLAVVMYGLDDNSRPLTRLYQFSMGRNGLLKKVTDRDMTDTMWVIGNTLDLQYLCSWDPFYLRSFSDEWQLPLIKTLRSFARLGSMSSNPEILELVLNSKISSLSISEVVKVLKGLIARIYDQGHFPTRISREADVFVYDRAKGLVQYSTL